MSELTPINQGSYRVTIRELANVRRITLDLGLLLLEIAGTTAARRELSSLSEAIWNCIYDEIPWQREWPSITADDAKSRIQEILSTVDEAVRFEKPLAIDPRLQVSLTQTAQRRKEQLTQQVQELKAHEQVWRQALDRLKVFSLQAPPDSKDFTNGYQAQRSDIEAVYSREFRIWKLLDRRIRMYIYFGEDVLAMDNAGDVSPSS